MKSCADTIFLGLSALRSLLPLHLLHPSHFEFLLFFLLSRIFFELFIYYYYSWGFEKGRGVFSIRSFYCCVFYYEFLNLFSSAFLVY